MKFTIPLRKLSKLDVKYVSLVDRGANRIPFRIIKQESDMAIDLARLGFRTKKSEASSVKQDETQVAEQAVAAVEPATLSAVILAKNDEQAISQVRDALTAEGIEFPDTKVFDDGTVALFKGEYQEGAVIRVSEHAGLIVKGFSPEYGNGTSIADTVATRGFYDNVGTAMNVAAEALYTAMASAASNEEAVTTVTKVMSDLADYVTSTAKALPITAFKAEKVVSNVVLSQDVAVTEQKSEVVEAPTTEKVEEPAVEVQANEQAPSEAPVVEAAPAEQPEITQPAAENTESELAAVLKAVASLADNMKVITESLTSVKQKVEDIEKSTEEKIDLLAQKADTASQAVRGAVVASETLGDDIQAPSKVKKQDADPRSGVFDTAFIRR